MSFKRISKISFKNDVMNITREVKINDRNQKDEVYKSYDEPHADFVNAFKELKQVVRDILQLPKDYASGEIIVSAVSLSFHEETEVEGAVISGYVKLETADSPFFFSTPHLPFEEYADMSGNKIMATKNIGFIEKLKEEAKKYLNGKRAQDDLFYDNEGDEREAA